MKHGRIALGALALLASSRLGAQTPEQMIQKAEARVKNAKSYQATIVMQGAMMGGPQTMSSTVKLIPGKKMAMTMAPLGIQVIDDGITMYSYIPAAKQYSKSPSQVKNQQQVGLSQIAGLSRQATLKLRPSENVGGKPAHVIQIIPKAPLGNQKMLMLLYIDKQTNTMRQLKTTMTAQMPGQTKPVTQTMLVTIKDEKFDAPIPDSVFKFTPPPGAKEAVGMGGMMGGTAPRPTPMPTPGSGSGR